MSMATIVAPTGVDARIDIKRPDMAQKTERQVDSITTPLKLCITLMAESAGKITKADIKSEPTRFMPKTIIIAIIIAIKRL